MSDPDFRLENPVSPVPVPAKTMTHAECVLYAATYLSKRCPVVLPEFFSHNNELPDVIGFSARQSILIECKVTRSDFLSDKNKSFRLNPEKGMGDYRYYCCPKGLISKDELPAGWGLLYVYPSGLVREVKSSYVPPGTDADLATDWLRGGKFKKNIQAEWYLLFYYARRAYFAGVHKAILEYRGFDS